jgi:hypothetical protein
MTSTCTHRNQAAKFIYQILFFNTRGKMFIFYLDNLVVREVLW